MTSRYEVRLYFDATKMVQVEAESEAAALEMAKAAADGITEFDWYEENGYFVQNLDTGEEWRDDENPVVDNDETV